MGEMAAACRRSRAAGPGTRLANAVVAEITAPVLLVQGGEDRVIPPAHAYWLLDQCREGELWLRPKDGHIAILDACPVALDWLRAHA